MKLLLITCIEEYEKDVKNILKHAGVKSFSYQSVKGYKNNGRLSEGNWFISEDIGTYSLMFTSFIESEYLNDIMSRIIKFNSDRDSQSRIHMASLKVDNYI